ncbi:MAG: RNA-binding S4 domain-containing protein [Sumerlaeia bacterium]
MSPIYNLPKKRLAPREVHINPLPIELAKLLKLQSLVQSGGEAKVAITEGLVRLNGVVETRKGKKIVAGDVIEFCDERFVVVD